jgi:hypothetical protein
MAAEYKERGIRFLYPENWLIASDKTAGWPHCVSVHSPSGAFWSLTLDSHPSEDLFERVLSAVSAEYEEVEQSQVERQIGDQTLNGVELHFYCLDFLVVAQVLQCPSDLGPMVLLLQAESREFESLGQVFDAMYLSLGS